MASLDPRLQRLERRAAGAEERAAELQCRVDELGAELVVRDQRIAKLTSENARLRGQLGKNSQNSSKPPSSDSPKERAARRKKRRKRSTGRRRGGQPGHKGHQRELIPSEQVTRTEERYPETCRRCDKDLAEVSHGEPVRHQTVEVPKVQPDVLEQRLHAVLCGCGTTTRAKPASGTPSGMCGPNLMAQITLMVGFYRLSRRDAVALCGDMLGVRISLGALSNVERRVSDMLAPAHTEAAKLVQAADVKHADATGWFHKSAGRTLWVIASTLASVFHIVGDGTQARFKELLGTLRGVLITDRGSQFGFWAMDKRQICRVGGDLTAPAPHRSGRAGYPHPVPHASGSLVQAYP